MGSDRFRIEPLGSHHDRAAFSCGVPALDAYIRERAGQDLRRRLSAVFVLFDTETDALIGYYTLSAASIQSAGLPEAMLRRLPRYDTLPAVLLGRLAVDVRYRGRGFGEILLLDALHRALAQSGQITAMAVVVDAKDDAAGHFYEHFGFQPLTNDARRLFLPMASIAKL